MTDLPSRLGESLSPDVLARRAALPRKPAPVELTGPNVRLVPLDLARDLADLHAGSCGNPVELGGRGTDAYDPDAHVWRYMSGGPFASADDLAAWLRPQVDAPDGLALSVRHRATDRAVGVVNYLANHPEHLKIELGSIWYSPAVQGTGVNAEATRLLCEHAFGLGYRRVEWKCDALNERSRRAALAFGFRFEGIQEAHYVVKGRNRDTAWFRILDHEWPAVSAARGSGPPTR